MLWVWQVYQFVQVIKCRQSECRIQQGFCVVLILDTFEFIREIIDKGIEEIIGTGNYK